MENAAIIAFFSIYVPNLLKHNRRSFKTLRSAIIVWKRFMKSEMSKKRKWPPFWNGLI